MQLSFLRRGPSFFLAHDRPRTTAAGCLAMARPPSEDPLAWPSGSVALARTALTAGLSLLLSCAAGGDAGRAAAMTWDLGAASACCAGLSLLAGGHGSNLGVEVATTVAGLGAISGLLVFPRRTAGAQRIARAAVVLPALLAMYFVRRFRRPAAAVAAVSSILRPQHHGGGPFGMVEQSSQRRMPRWRRDGADYADAAALAASSVSTCGT